MTSSREADASSQERQRILAEYRRRSLQVEPDLYAPWQPSVVFIRASRIRTAAAMLRSAGAFPKAGDACLEVGFGALGWLGELIAWGVREQDLHGIELEPGRVAKAREVLPHADLQVGDGSELPWQSNSFRLVVVSTVFTSILDAAVRRSVAAEITRVLSPGGALLWYDFAINNPRNPHVKKVGRRELRSLFPQLTGSVRSETLAPPLARFVAPRSWTLATLLAAIPLLRTHLIAVLRKVS